MSFNLFKRKPEQDDTEIVIEEQTKPAVVFAEKLDKNTLAMKRGFNDFEHAVSFLQSSSFQNLGQADRDEFTNWIKNIK